MTGSWEWSDHLCRTCLSRIVRRTDGPGGEARPVWQCGNCGREAQGTPAGICGCGILPESSRPGPRYRCVPNPAQGVASPGAIVIEFSETPPAQARS